MRGRIVAIVPAAGIGRRFGKDENKSFVDLGRKPLLLWALGTLGSMPEVDEIIPVLRKSDMEPALELFERYNITKIKRIAPGGKERQESVFHGLGLVKDSDSVILVHDGARPLITPHVVRNAVGALSGCDGVVVGVPVKDTIKEVAEGGVLRTLNRQSLWAVQTPQIFPFGTVYGAYERAMRESFYSTDDSALVERYGGRIKVVMGSYRNIKITTPEDLGIAEAFLREEGGA